MRFLYFYILGSTSLCFICFWLSGFKKVFNPKRIENIIWITIKNWIRNLSVYNLQLRPSIQQIFLILSSWRCWIQNNLSSKNLSKTYELSFLPISFTVCKHLPLSIAYLFQPKLIFSKVLIYLGTTCFKSCRRS